MSRPYDELVRQGQDGLRQLRRTEDFTKDGKWTIGDAALDVAPRGSDEGETKLMEFAYAIGCSVRDVRAYRKVAAAWPTRRRSPDAPWSVHRALMTRDDRFEMLTRLGEETVGRRVTVNDARNAARKAPVDQTKSTTDEQPASVPSDHAELPPDRPVSFIPDKGVAELARAVFGMRVACRQFSACAGRFDADSQRRANERLDELSTLLPWAYDLVNGLSLDDAVEQILGLEED